jgi:16S rRNA G966 N2-methylase RsmD
MTLREHLADALPRFPLNSAWPEAIRASRSWGRRAERKPQLGGRGDVDRLLALRHATDLDAAELKAALKAVLDTPEDDLAVATLDAQVGRLLPRIIRGLVPLRVEGAPIGFEPPSVRRLTGLEAIPSLVEPVTAAILRRRFDGQILGGSRLRIEVDLPAGRILPPVPRDLRAEPPPRQRPSPWLKHLDEEGLWSLTPLAIGRRQAQAAMGSVIIDVGCGCGGNAIAFAEAGFQVLAIEPNARRRELAAKNFAERHVSDSIELLPGTAREMLPKALRRDPNAAIFIDPPWGGPEWAKELTSWSDLIAPLDVPEPLLRMGAQLIVKAPRTFDVTTLPGAETWAIQYEFGDNPDDSRIVKCITASAWSPTVRAFQLLDDL